ncbi:hypothetical protein GCM10007301_45890 [Azorhizobium oxalatiphilum]|uniref:CENP-V/GFA domain-containing protein n=1 Tax=Azorhizobium oxalatiphilum TaxID=980631 RepID=A0A917CB26_9HYPH|nr:GFA family protein [Azorhizobium oxalatiphilum]GGF80590.1 hypothetical protein GCM10007301_45890 [Azorhizobium oxalatiphilum]
MGFLGSCQCKAVRYEVDRLHSDIIQCHCQTCRKTHASDHISTARVLREDFRWLSGEDKLSGYESTPGKIRHFCSVCGSHLMAHWPDQPFVMVRVGTLDEDPGARAVRHIWASHRVPWLADGEDAPYYETVP